MKTVHWLFVISVALFISGIGFVIAAERTSRAAGPAAASSTRVAAPIATVKQVMDGIVAPAASLIWDSVSTTVSEKGVENKMPETDEEWAQVARSAALLVESANLLLEGDRAVDQGEWPKISQAMATAGMKALDAAKAKDPEAILSVGEEIYASCETCHATYVRE